MSTHADSIPVPGVVIRGPVMPNEDMQELLVHRVTERSLGVMRGKITAVLSAVVLVATLLGVQAFLKIRSLDDTVEQVNHMVDSLQRRSDALNGEIESARRSRAELDAGVARQRADFVGMLSGFQSEAAGAARAAYTAASDADQASRGVAALSTLAAAHRDTLERLRGEVALAARAVDRHDSVVEGMQRALHTQVFETWNLVLDENADFTPVGESGLKAKATRIHRGDVADVVLADPGHGMATVCSPELHVGSEVVCRYNGADYRITLAWAMKQGMLGGLFGMYRDRAQVQVVRFPLGVPAPSSP